MFLKLSEKFPFKTNLRVLLEYVGSVTAGLISFHFSTACENFLLLNRKVAGASRSSLWR